MARFDDTSLERKFPHHNIDERNNIRDLLNCVDRKSDAFLRAKQFFIRDIFTDLVKFYDWQATAQARQDLRRRLLTLSGMFIIVPIAELREVSHKAKLTQKKVVYDHPASPLGQEMAEFHSYDLKYMPPFAQVFSQIALDPDQTALDYIAGNREKRHYPQTQFTVFRKRIQDEVIAHNYLTASAEPLTQTQIISLYNPEGAVRDLITTGFDLVYESAFVDFYHHAPVIRSETLVRNANIMALHFLHSAVDRINYHMEQKKNLAEHFPVFLNAEDNKSADHWEKLLIFVTENLTPAVINRIRLGNVKLGLDADSQEIEWL